MKRTRVTQQDLEKIVAIWQRRLRLQDWEVKIRFAHRYELGRRTIAIARNEFDLAKRSCQILLVYPSEIKPDNQRDTDIEDSIVHELLHLHHLPLEQEHEPTDLEHTFLEQMIEVLSEALVTAYRKPPAPRPLGRNGYRGGE